MIGEDLRDLVQQTAQHAEQWNDGHDHTVAAGLLTRSGQVVLGLNTYHFLGGPCGEIAALSNHAASHPDDPIIAVAAVSGVAGGPIAPCGKCRQVFYDLDQNIRFVVRDAAGLTSRTAAELLPFAFDWHAAEQPQRIYMWEGYEAAIRSGAKTQSIRIDDPFTLGPAELVFEKGDGEVLSMVATVTEVRQTTRADLTQEDAVRDGFSDLDELQKALNTHYPSVGPSARVDVVTFALSRTGG